MQDSEAIESGFVELPNAQLFYEVWGQGHPLVLVHAGIADRRMWDGQIQAFARQYRVIRYDLRGHGQSTIASGPYSHSQDLYDLLKFLQIESAYLVGCSLGGMTSIDFTLTHPDKVDALLPVSCFPSGYWTHNPELSRPNDHLLKMSMDVKELMARGDLPGAADRETDYLLTGPQRTTDDVQITPSIYTLLHEMNRVAVQKEATAQGKEQPLMPPSITRLYEIHIPTLIIVGDQDDEDVLKGAQILASRIPNAQKAVVSDTAHMLNMEKPDVFNTLVLDFLAHL